MDERNAKSGPKWLIATLLILGLVFGLGQMVGAADKVAGSGPVAKPSHQKIDQGVPPGGYGLGDIPLDKATYDSLIKPVPKTRLDAWDAWHPTSYDARDDGIVTSPKNQGACGSCWAFASAGAMESHYLKKYASGPYDLSEQQLLSCNPWGFSCSGGNMTAIQYWDTTNDNGTTTEYWFPYTASASTPCDTSAPESRFRVTGWHTVTATEYYFKESCYNDGPSYWRYDVYSDFSDGYGNGFWYDASPGDVYVNVQNSSPRGGHAVLIIGWDDSKGAYLCKNSWGATGGPNGDGTFWIAYSGHYHDLGFGMANFDLSATEGGEAVSCIGERDEFQTPIFYSTTTSVGSGRAIGFQATSDFTISSVGFRGALLNESYDVVIYSSTDGHTAGSILYSTSYTTGGSGYGWYDMPVDFSFNSGSYYVVNWRPTDGGYSDWVDEPGMDYYHDDGLPYAIGPVNIVEGFSGFNAESSSNFLHPFLRFCFSETFEYCFNTTGDGGRTWYFNVIDDSIWPYLILSGYVDAGSWVRQATAIYNGYNCAITFSGEDGPNAGDCPWTENFRFSGPTGQGVWINVTPSAGHGSVTVTLCGASSQTESEPEGGPKAGVEK